MLLPLQKNSSKMKGRAKISESNCEKISSKMDGRANISESKVTNSIFKNWMFQCQLWFKYNIDFLKNFP